MGRKLTIVVTCTDRKAAPPQPSLMMRNVPDGPVTDQVAQWTRALAAAPGQRALIDLYRGESWSQVLALADDARAAGFDPRLLVASAGLGLRDATSLSPPYAATFSPRQPDSVARSVDGARTWWHAMRDSEAGSPADLDGPSLMILSNEYSRVVANDLLGNRNPEDTLVFGGSDDVFNAMRVAADKRLRTALGGTLTSLNVRMARGWLQMGPAEDTFAPSRRDHWAQWATRARHVEIHNRRPLSDGEVQSRVTAMRRLDPTISKSRALRALRDDGFACEQHRFAKIFDMVSAVLRSTETSEGGAHGG